MPAPTTRQDQAAHEGCGADGCVTFGGCGVCGGEAAFEARRGLIAKAAKVVHSARYTSDEEPTAVDDLIVQALADEHLLADPAQTTELEQLRFLNGEAEHVIARALDELRERTAERDRLQDQVAAGHRVQLAIAAQWLGHAAEKLGGAPGTDYLEALAEWLTGNAEGDEPEPADDTADVVAERDALSLLLRGMARKLSLIVHARAALVGDQPKAEEPKPRCCIGPFADGTHAPGCLDACQDCGGDEAGPHRCQCGDVDPVCTCTPSRCDYDGYPLDGPACLPCGQRPVGKPCLAIDDTPRAVEEADDAAEPHHSPPPDPASLTEGEA